MTAQKSIFPLKMESWRLKENLSRGIFSCSEPILEWLNPYAKDPLPETELTFKFTYFNTASSKLILDILTVLEKMNE